MLHPVLGIVVMHQNNSFVLTSNRRITKIYIYTDIIPEAKIVNRKAKVIISSSFFSLSFVLVYHISRHLKCIAVKLSKIEKN